MNTYETSHIIEGRGAVIMVLDLDELQALVNSVFQTLKAANFIKAESGTSTRGSYSYRKYTNGYGVFASKEYAWVQIRNFDKAGQEISAEKYLPALLAAGIEAKMEFKRITLKVERKEKVGA